MCINFCRRINISDLSLLICGTERNEITKIPLIKLSHLVQIFTVWTPLCTQEFPKLRPTISIIQIPVGACDLSPTACMVLFRYIFVANCAVLHLFVRWRQKKIYIYSRSIFKQLHLIEVAIMIAKDRQGTLKSRGKTFKSITLLSPAFFFLNMYLNLWNVKIIKIRFSKIKLHRLPNEKKGFKMH